MTASHVELARNPLIATDVDVNGVHTLKVTGVTTGLTPLTAYAAGHVVLSTENNGVFTNEGAAGLATFTLPAASAGLTYIFIVENINGVKVQAVGDDTINLAGMETSAAAGFIQSVIVGSTITLVAINATEWMTIALNGTWSAT